MESEAEIVRLAERRRRAEGSDAERSGESVLDLVIEDHQPGVGGQLLLLLVKRNRTLGLPWTRLKVGSPVIVSSQDEQEPGSVQGVVCARNARSLQVAVYDWPPGDRLRVDLSADEITRKRQRAALMAVREARGRLAQLRQIMLGDAQPSFGPPVAVTMTCDDSSLNESQRSAVRFALAANDLAIIHGPPGTGKTTTVVELIRQIVRNEEKVLACAPSNTAVDNLLERLVAAGVRCVRLGHPARVMGELQSHTLDSLVAGHENMRWVKSLLRESTDLFRQAGRYTRARPAKHARREMRDDARQLKSQARELERQAIEDVLDKSDVVCATTTLDEKLLGNRHFEWAIIDEACQSTEPGGWIPIRRANRIVLAGDHCQLPPTVISPAAARQGFAVSLMERLIGLHGPIAAKMLKVQYRMHQQIMRFSSQRFYQSELIADDSVASHLLADLPGVSGQHAGPPELLTEPMTLIDTAGADYDEELEPDGESKRNPQEAELVLKKAAQLAAAGIAWKDIAVIAPYAAQVRLIRAQRESDDLEVDTVDGFQGREKEAVIITLVRSNRAREIGFLSDTRRMNVALTRARRKLIVIGDSATLGGHEFYADLLAFFEQQGGYHSVWEEP